MLAYLNQVAAAAANGLHDLLALLRRLYVMHRLRDVLTPLAHHSVMMTAMPLPPMPTGSTYAKIFDAS